MDNCMKSIYAEVNAINLKAISMLYFMPSVINHKNISDTQMKPC